MGRARELGAGGMGGVGGSGRGRRWRDPAQAGERVGGRDAVQAACSMLAFVLLCLCVQCVCRVRVAPPMEHVALCAHDVLNVWYV